MQKQIYTQFKKLGYRRGNSFGRFEIKQVMDRICIQNTGFQHFDEDVAQELWALCTKNSSTTVRLQSYMNMIIKAEKILRKEYWTVKEKMKSFHQSYLEQLDIELQNIVKEHYNLTSPFGLPSIVENQMVSSVKFSSSAKQSKLQTTTPPNNDTKSFRLILGLVITLFVLGFQFIVMFHKHHFFSLLVVLAVLSKYFLGYFDKPYIKLVLILLGASIVLDAIWLAVMTQYFWTPKAETHHSILNSGFLKFTVVMVGVLMALRVLLIAIFFKYHDSEKKYEVISIFGSKIKLDGNPKGNLWTPYLNNVFRNDR